jgi:hypothetical protein
VVAVSRAAERPDATGTADAEPVGEPSYEAPRIAAGAAVASAFLATVALASSALPALGPAGFGAGVIAVGAAQGRQRLISLGAALLFAGLLLAGTEGGRPPALLLGAVGVAVAYDAGRYAVRLGHQLRGGPTGRAELVHVGATATVATAAAAVGGVAFSLGGGGQPSTALVALLLAAVLFVWALLR